MPPFLCTGLQGCTISIYACHRQSQILERPTTSNRPAVNSTYYAVVSGWPRVVSIPPPARGATVGPGGWTKGGQGTCPCAVRKCAIPLPRAGVRKGGLTVPPPYATVHKGWGLQPCALCRLKPGW